MIWMVRAPGYRRALGCMHNRSGPMTRIFLGAALAPSRH